MVFMRNTAVPASLEQRASGSVRALWSAALFGVVVLGASVAGKAQADDELHYNRVSLEASATTEVANDELFVTLQSTHEGESSAAVSDKINQDMQWALAEVANMDKVKAQTQQYNVHPNYDKQRKITGWKGYQSLELNSTEVTEITSVLSRLQSRLAVTNMRYAPSLATREAAQRALIDDAVAAYHARAEQIAKAFGKSTYQIVELSVNTQSGGFRPPMMVRAAKAMPMADSVSAPGVAEGSSQVQVSVSGTVQLRD